MLTHRIFFILFLLSFSNYQVIRSDDKPRINQIGPCSFQCACGACRHPECAGEDNCDCYADFECSGDQVFTIETSVSDCKSNNQKLNDYCKQNCGCPVNNSTGGHVFDSTGTMTIFHPSGDEQKEITCKNGSYVSEIFGTEGALIDSIGMKCSDGTYLNPTKPTNITNQKLPVIGGGGGAKYFNFACDKGFTGIAGKSGRYIYQIDNLNNQCNINYKPAGTGKDIEPGHSTYPFSLKCDSGKKIIGYYGRSGTYVDNLGIICG